MPATVIPRRPRPNWSGVKDCGAFQFKRFVEQMGHHDMVPPTCEDTARVLIIQAIAGDDLATMALADLYEQEGMPEAQAKLNRIMPSMRTTFASWTKETRATFRRYCRLNGWL